MTQVNQYRSIPKTILKIFALLLPGTLAACGGGGLGQTTTINAKLDAWTMGAGRTLQAKTVQMGTQSNSVMLASSPIAADGSFSLTLPAVNETTLTPYGGGTYCNSSSCMVLSDPAIVKSAEVDFEIANVSAVQPQKKSTDGTLIAYYEYVDQDITVTGKSSLSGSTTATFDLHYKAGWNIRTINFAATNVPYTSVQTIDDYKWVWGIN